MRLIYFSPEIDPMMGVTLTDFFNKKKSAKKLSYLIIESLKNHPNETYFFIKDGKNIFKNRFLNKLKFLFWAKINKYPIEFRKILDSTSFFGATDVLFCNARRCLKDNSLEFFISFKSLKKIAHLDHYMTDTGKIAANAKRYKIDAYIASANLYKTSAFFRYFFPFVSRDVYVLPHVAESRFNKKTNFSTRINKAFVAGSIAIFDRTEPYLKDFFDYFPDSVYHPMRKKIYDNETILRDFIDHKLYITYITSKKNSVAMLKKYHSDFNMVDAYNSYKMFLAPEELSGMSAISFIEGLSCGAVFIGKKGAMYEDLGFRDGVNYIAYNGSLEDLSKKIIFYQKNSEKLKIIADNSYSFFLEKFTQQKVFETFFIDILNYANGISHPKSSFVIQP